MCSFETLPYAQPDQVIGIDGTQVQPDAVLYRVDRDTQSEEFVTQLLVPRSHWEVIFQAAHFNPMAGHLGYDKTLNLIMAQFYWPGIRRRCAGVLDLMKDDWEEGSIERKN